MATASSVLSNGIMKINKLQGDKEHLISVRRLLSVFKELSDVATRTKDLAVNGDHYVAANSIYHVVCPRSFICIYEHRAHAIHCQSMWCGIMR